MSLKTALNVINEDEEIEYEADDRYVNPDDEVQEIKYIQIKSSEETELLQLGQKLLEEFDTLGICETPINLNSGEDVYVNLIVNGFILVNNHRKMLTEMKNNNYTNTRLKEDNIKLEKEIDTLKQTVNQKEEFVESMNKKITLKNMECEDLCKKASNLQQQLICIKKLLSSKENGWKHKIRQLQIENNDLKGVAERSTGSFISKDLITANIIQKYKMNEENYKNIIKKLQENNQELLQHLFQLMHISKTSIAS